MSNNEHADDGPLIYGYRLNNRGGHTALKLAEAEWKASRGSWTWLHFDRTLPETEKWLREHCPIPAAAVNAMLAEETRPGILSFDTGHVINLRGVNTHETEEPQALLALRMWVDACGVISVRRLELKAASNTAQYIEKATKPISKGSFLIQICQLLTQRLDDQLDLIQDRLGELEDIAFEDVTTHNRNQLIKLRRELIPYKRYMLPQRNAISRLRSLDGKLFSTENNHDLLELDNQNTRILEQLDSIGEQASLLSEDFANRDRDAANRNSYLLAIVAAVFLPLGFLTGLFGMNLGGMPGIDHPNGFLIVSGILLAIVAIEVAILKWWKWF